VSRTLPSQSKLLNAIKTGAVKIRPLLSKYSLFMKKLLLRIDMLVQIYIVQSLLVVMTPWITTILILFFNKNKTTFILFICASLYFVLFLFVKMIADEIMTDYCKSKHIYNQWLMCYKGEIMYIMPPECEFREKNCTIYIYNIKMKLVVSMRKNISNYFFATKFAPAFDWQIKKYNLRKKEIEILLGSPSIYKNE
jgi:hypothetical protein